MNKLFYGWRVVFAAGSLQFMLSMLLNQAFGIYLVVLVEEKGWSKTSLSAAASMQSTEIAVLGLVLGWLVDRFGSQVLVRTGVILFGTGLMLLSRIDTILSFYGAYLVITLGSSMFSNFLLSVSIIQWFERHRTRALSAIQFGGALGGLFVFIVAWSIHTFGWRTTAFSSGVIAILVGYPLSRIIRSRPEDLGLTVDGLPPASKDTAAKSDAPNAPAAVAFTAREALRTSAFWLISLGHAFSLLVVIAVNVHAVSHIKNGLGYTLQQASLFFALVTAGQMAGVMLGWFIGDKFVKRKIASTCMLMHATGLLMLTYSTGALMLVLALLVHGVAWGLRGPFMHAIRADYFGRASIGSIMGLSTMVTVFGNIGGPIIAGAFADIYGNYRVGFTVLALMAAAGSLFFWTAKPPKLPRGRRVVTARTP